MSKTTELTSEQKIRTGLDKSDLKIEANSKLPSNPFNTVKKLQLEDYVGQRFYLKDLYQVSLDTRDEIRRLDQEIERLKNRRVIVKKRLVEHFSQQFEKLIGSGEK